MAKIRRISAKQLLIDIKAGTTREEILQKYGISVTQLEDFAKLIVSKGALSNAEAEKLLNGGGQTNGDKDQGERVTMDMPSEPAPISSVPQFLLKPKKRKQSALPVDSPVESEARDRGWSIKLYGHIAADREAFCRDLGVLVGISPIEAERCLYRAPCAIKSGLSKTKAEALHKILISIGALTLVEENVKENESDDKTPLPSPELMLEIAKQSREPDWVPRGMQLTTVGLVLLFTAVAILGFYLLKATAPVREKQAFGGNIRPAIQTPAKSNLEDKRPAIDPIERVKFHIADVEDEIGKLKSEIELQKDILESMMKMKSPLEELFAKDREISALQGRLGRKIKELRIANRTLNSMDQASSSDSQR